MKEMKGSMDHLHSSRNSHSSQIPAGEREEHVQQDLLDYVNYHISGGSLTPLTAGSEEADSRFAAVLKSRDIRAYRQECGGVLTEVQQLEQIPGVSPEMLSQLAGATSELDSGKLRVLAPQTTRHNRVDPYVNGPQCLDMLLGEIRKAERYIHLSVMLFFNDQSGNRIASELLQALERGVEVRMMVNYTVTALGYGNNLEVGQFSRIAGRLERAGAKLLDTFHSYYAAEEWAVKRKVLKSQGVPESILFLQDKVQEDVEVTGLNVIDHRKFMVIDGTTAIIGSLNIGDQYTYATPIQEAPDQQVDGRPLGIPAKEEEWHDGCFRIQGAAAQPLNAVFQSRWLLLGGDHFDIGAPFYRPAVNYAFGEEECTLFVSFPGNPVNLIQQYLLDLITYAADETLILNPYLIDQAFWDRLGEVGPERACHISICNPLEVNDHPTNKAAVRSNMYVPFSNGVSFYDYSSTERFSHWKITYDRRSQAVFHGSYNINERSACHDFELGMLVKGRSLAEKVKRMMDYDLSVSRRISDKHEFFKHPWLHPSTYLNKATQNYT
ncbi:phospholipase D-like domain-containing protein [Paenibacillus tritici]|uniref:phospholipase D-like domain-containing protein n=1 Tax=Paenibacillus tritici TaxID=1873425 RepID=UPI001FEA5E86|nr:phosphatidylserine/phosphatidylglycerophosphate/cardiolipin synthase family protein [Paenibacillus tritici]